MSEQTFQFLHAADLHLDSPLRGLSRRDFESAVFTNASRRALENLVAAALDAQVAFVVIAGDIYDGDWKDFSTGQFFVRQMSRLAQAKIDVFILRGNHDAMSVISRDLPLPTNVHSFPTNKAGTVTLPALGVALHGRGFPERHMPENMALTYPSAVPGHFNIGVLHTSLTGREGHDVYAPCTIADLERAGYDYWALGHIHQREVVCERPAIVFPGNLQGRHARETGPKGATLVRVADGRVARLTALTLDAARFETVTLDLAGVETRAALLDQVRGALAIAVEEADGRPLAARLALTGRTRLAPSLLADPGQLHEEMTAVAAEVSDRLLIEKVSVSNLAPQKERASLPDGFERILAEVATDPQVQADIARALRALHTSAPPPAMKLLGLDPPGDDDAFVPRVEAAMKDAAAAILAHLDDGSEIA